MPTPPEAITGTRTASATARVSARSKPRLGAVAIHRGEQDFAGAELRRPLARSATASMPVGVRPPWVKISQRSPRLADRLASMATTMHWLPNFSAASRDEVAVGDGRGVDRDLVGAGEQQRAHVVERAHAAADGQRHEAVFGGAPHDVEQDAAVLVAGGDVEEAEFVGAGGVIGDAPLRPDRRRRADRRN